MANTYRGIMTVGSAIAALTLWISLSGSSHLMAQTAVNAPNTVVNIGPPSPPLVFPSTNGAPQVSNIGDPYSTGWVRPANWFSDNLWTFPIVNASGDRFWYRLEYLRWWTEGMDVPALVTTSPPSTPQSQAGVLGQPDTVVVFGASEINDSSESGIRTQSGLWLTAQRNFALESEYFRLASQTDGYAGSSDGSVILARPFFDMLAADEASQLVAFPNLVSGDLVVGSKTKIESYLVNVRAKLSPNYPVQCVNCQSGDQIDWLIGYRFMQLKDRLTFNQQTTSLVPTAPGSVAVFEQFDTRNQFHGAQFGFVFRSAYQRAWIESLLRVAIGGNNQRVRITGASTITSGGTTTNHTGGLLAQRSNIGIYERSQFTMIPEIGFNMGFRIRDWIAVTTGYTVMYFPNVVRAGDQIDRDLNPNLIPPETVPFSGPLRPEFRFVESDYWAHGLNLGAELRF